MIWEEYCTQFETWFLNIDITNNASALVGTFYEKIDKDHFTIIRAWEVKAKYLSVNFVADRVFV